MYQQVSYIDAGNDVQSFVYVGTYLSTIGMMAATDTLYLIMSSLTIHWVDFVGVGTIVRCLLMIEHQIIFGSIGIGFHRMGKYLQQ